MMSAATILEILFFVIIIWFVVRAYQSQKHQNFSSINAVIIWVLIFVVLIITYAFRFELGSLRDRVLAVIIPSYSWTNNQGQLIISRYRDGHFYLNATTEQGDTINFLVDTGASDIALTKSAAIKLGFNPERLKYNRRYLTANGVSYAAPVRIKKLTIGKKTFYNLEAHVTSGDLDTSLLGMSIIDDFRDFKITKDLLILSY